MLIPAWSASSSITSIFICFCLLGSDCNHWISPLSLPGFFRQTVKYLCFDVLSKCKSCVLCPSIGFLDKCSKPFQLRLPWQFKSFNNRFCVCCLRFSMVPDKTINIFHPQSAAIAIKAAILAVFPDWTLPITNPLTGFISVVSLLSLFKIFNVVLSISSTISSLKPPLINFFLYNCHADCGSAGTVTSLSSPSPIIIAWPLR